jgi:transcriptional regulator with XRE-family HTH domain
MGMNFEELGIQVREARRQANLTQLELARQANVGRMDISRLEKGQNVTMKTFYKIVNALPSLTDIHLGAVRLRKDGEEPAGGSREELRARAAELLGRLPAPGAPAQDEAALRREQSLIRMFAELLLEITSDR